MTFWSVKPFSLDFPRPLPLTSFFCKLLFKSWMTWIKLFFSFSLELFWVKIFPFFFFCIFILSLNWITKAFDSNLSVKAFTSYIRSNMIMIVTEITYTILFPNTTERQITYPLHGSSNFILVLCTCLNSTLNYYQIISKTLFRDSYPFFHSHKFLK